MKKILLVDDSPFILKVLSDLLIDLNYEVSAFSCSSKAYAEAEQKPYDAVITDLNMPGMDGIDFTRKVKSIPHFRFVPVVMLSAEGDSERIDEAKRMGISTFLQKPVSESKLKAILQVAVGGTD